MPGGRSSGIRLELRLFTGANSRSVEAIRRDCSHFRGRSRADAQAPKCERPRSGDRLAVPRCSLPLSRSSLGVSRRHRTKPRMPKHSRTSITGGSLRFRGAMPRFAARPLLPFEPCGSLRRVQPALAVRKCLADESASALPNPAIWRQCPCLAEGTGRIPRRSGGAAFCRAGQASRAIGHCRFERWGRETRVSLTPSMPFRPACRTSRPSLAIRAVGRPPKWHQPADVHPGEFRPATSLPSVCARGCQLGVGPGWDHQS